MLTNIEFCEQKIVVDKYLQQMVNEQHGAQDIFIGKVRNYNQNRAVVGIEYEIFVPLALTLLNKLCLQVRQDIDEQADIIIVHRSGFLTVGDISVLIIVGTKHRNEAFVASRYIIENIKHDIPIWKQEHYVNGRSEWVLGHALCQHG